MLEYSDLRAAQHTLADAIYRYRGRQLVLGMGGGKTAAALTAVRDLLNDGQIDYALVVAPPLVAATVWPKEPAKWRHLERMRVRALQGTPKQRERLLDAVDGAHFFVVSEYLVDWLVKALPTHMADQRWALILDDCSIRSPTSKIAKAIRDKLTPLIYPEVIVRLTGTPRPNGIEDQWMPMQIVTRGAIWNERDEDEKLGAFQSWRVRNFRPLDHNGYRWKVHSFRERQLVRDIAEWTTTIDDKDMPELPELNHGEGFDTDLELPPKARAAYDEMEKKLVAEVQATLRAQPGASEEDAEALLVAALSEGVKSGKLAQIAQGYLYDEGEAVSDLHDGKTQALREIVEANGAEPLLVVYGYKHDLRLIEKVLGKKVPTLTGLSGTKAERVIDQWNAGDLPYLLLHPASAAHGIELQHGPGRRMALFCPLWSPDQYAQLVRRVQRPGQARPVFVHGIVAKGTVDELKRARVHHQLAEQNRFKEMLNEVLK